MLKLTTTHLVTILALGTSYNCKAETFVEDNITSPSSTLTARQLEVNIPVAPLFPALKKSEMIIDENRVSKTDDLSVFKNQVEKKKDPFNKTMEGSSMIPIILDKALEYSIFIPGVGQILTPVRLASGPIIEMVSNHINGNQEKTITKNQEAIDALKKAIANKQAEISNLKNNIKTSTVEENIEKKETPEKNFMDYIKEAGEAVKDFAVDAVKSEIRYDTIKLILNGNKSDETIKNQDQEKTNLGQQYLQTLEESAKQTAIKQQELNEKMDAIKKLEEEVARLQNPSPSNS